MKNKEFFDILHTRRRIKQFTDNKVPYKDLLEIVKGARLAPSSINFQSRSLRLFKINP